MKSIKRADADRKWIHRPLFDGLRHLQNIDTVQHSIQSFGSFRKILID